MTTPNIVPLSKAHLCESCLCISDSTGERCMGCGSVGSLMSISRILNPCPALGQITYIFAGNELDS